MPQPSVCLLPFARHLSIDVTLGDVFVVVPVPGQLALDTLQFVGADNENQGRQIEVWLVGSPEGDYVFSDGLPPLSNLWPNRTLPFQGGAVSLLVQLLAVTVWPGGYVQERDVAALEWPSVEEVQAALGAWSRWPVPVVPGISTGNSALDVDPAVILADGTDSCTVTMTVRDVNFALVEGAVVALAVSGDGNVVTQPDPTDANGECVGSFTTTVAEEKEVSASVGTVALAEPVTVTAEEP